MSIFIRSAAIQKDDLFIPVVIVDGEDRYFSSPLRDNDPLLEYKKREDALEYADSAIAELKKIVLRELQAMEFIMPLP